MKLCTVPGCPEPYAGKGLCGWHYDRRRVGDLAALEGPRPPAPTCSDCGVRLRSLNQHRCIPCQNIRDESTPNPMVCVCPVPDADPRRDFGMCRNTGCGRKPLALMKEAKA